MNGFFHQCLLFSSSKQFTMQITWVKKTESATRKNAVKPSFLIIYVHINIYDVFPVSFSFSVTHIRTQHTYKQIHA